MNHYAVYILSGAARRAIRSAPGSQTAIGFPVGLTQSHLSDLLRGERFGARVKAKVDHLCAALGVPPAAATRYVGRARR